MKETETKDDNCADHRLGLSVVTVLGVGAASVSRAQKSQRNDAESHGQGSPERDRLAKLEADVEMARLEQEVARASLIDLLKKCDHLELLQETDFMTPIGLSIEIVKALTGEDASKDRSLAMAIAAADDSQKKELETSSFKGVKKQFDVLNAAKARRTKDYWEKSRTLSEKQISLEEMRKKYQNENR